MFANVVLLLWPIFCLSLYLYTDRIKATFFTIVGGYLLLPVGTYFDFPMVPSLAKDEISTLSALLGLIFIKKEKICFFGRTRSQKIAVFTILFVVFINAFFNTEPVFNGLYFLPGLTSYNAITQVIEQYIFLLPFIISLNLIRDRKDLDEVIELFIYCTLAYSLLALIEIRLSPQLHKWVYGYHPHTFGQQIRFGGYRPVVFVGHGLLVAMLFMTSYAFCLMQYMIKNTKKYLYFSAYFFVVLLLCKTISAIVWAILFSFIFLLSLKKIKLMSKMIFLLFFLYPFLAVFQLIPYQEILDFVIGFDQNRHQSLHFRFVNEIALVQHSIDKFFIGWGSWGRNMLDGTVVDGVWLIYFTQYGFFYFILVFLLFNMSVFITRNNEDITVYFSFFIAIFSMDQLINSSLSHSWIWFLSGLLVSYINSISTKKSY